MRAKAVVGNDMRARSDDVENEVFEKVELSYEVRVCNKARSMWAT